MDNSIEVFNCPLCSFCETGLDRLVKHIRQHIKPEPKSSPSITSSNNSSRSDSNEQILPRGYEESTDPPNQSKEMNLDDCISNLSSKELTASTISLFSSVDREPSPPATTTASTSQSAKTNTNSGAVSSKASLNVTKSVPHQQQVQQRIQLAALPSEHQSLHLVNVAEPAQQPQIFQPMQISPPSLPQPAPGHQMMFIRPGEAPKYMAREQHFNGKTAYPHPTQYKQYVHAEQYVPIAPANVTKFQDGKQIIQLDMHDVYHRGSQPHQHGNHHQNVAYVQQQQQQQQQQQYPRNGSMKGRQNQPEVHGNFCLLYTSPSPRDS